MRLADANDHLDELTGVHAEDREPGFIGAKAGGVGCH
jgi:hypothetical protein